MDLGLRVLATVADDSSILTHLPIPLPSGPRSKSAAGWDDSSPGVSQPQWTIGRVVR